MLLTFHNIFYFVFFKINISQIRLQLVFTTSAFPENMENVVFIIKILETGMNVFKSHSQIIESKKYYEILTIYECVEK